VLADLLVQFADAAPGLLDGHVHRKAIALKLSLDSSEPLQDAIRVVGALYGVTLVVAPEASEPDQPTESIELSAPDQPVDAGERIEPAGSGTASRRSSPAKRRRSRSRGSAPRSAATVEEGNAAEPLPAPTNAEVRSWARENGVTVNDRGRVPASVLAAYRNAQLG
jgi:hypothetical protein